MVYSFRPQGVCAMQMNVDVENDIIKSVQIIGGCAGNTKGVSTLLEGMNINDAINPITTATMKNIIPFLISPCTA